MPQFVEAMAGPRSIIRGGWKQHLVIGQDPPLDGLYVHLGERLSQFWSIVVSGYGSQWSLSTVVVAATRCHRRGLSFAVIGR